ncbi:MAG TPA: response regulator [Candidatus Limnocylindria bacterium]|nr:response regulator [Candidatus Limnocylindria bacterium]
MTMCGRVLVVEDDAVLRETLEEVLRDEGHEVRTAAHGQEALDLMDEWHPELIILDLMMPVMDGFAFRDEQLRKGIALGTRVLVLSAARDLEAAATRVTADAFLSKPFRLDEVLSSVSLLLGAPGRYGPGDGTSPPVS